MNSPGEHPSPINRNRSRAVAVLFSVGLLSGITLGSVATMYIYTKRLEAEGFTFERWKIIQEEFPRYDREHHEAMDLLASSQSSIFVALTRNESDRMRNLLRKQIVDYTKSNPLETRISKDPDSPRSMAVKAVQKAMDEDPTLRAEILGKSTVPPEGPGK